MYINAGARDLLLRGERDRFLKEAWPAVRATIRRLGFTAEELLQAGGSGETQTDASQEK
jgi:GntR family transcriptional regulator